MITTEIHSPTKISCKVQNFPGNSSGKAFKTISIIVHDQTGEIYQVTLYTSLEGPDLENLMLGGKQE